MAENGLVAFITGASSGIGLELARELSGKGHAVALCARREDRLARLVREIESAGGKAAAIRCDVNAEGDLERAVDDTLARFGRIDIAVANAGFGVVGRLESLTLDDYRRQFETNVFGVLRTVYAVLPALKRSRGRLALMGSVAGYVSLPGMSAYAMSKSAVRALSETLEHELAPHGISVTLLTPGLVATEIRRVDNRGVFRPGAPEAQTWLHVPADKAARAIVRAILKRRREEVVTTHGKIMVLLSRIAPWFLRFLYRLGLKGRKAPAPHSKLTDASGRVK